MPTYQIEMLWICIQCGHKGNRGLARHCDHCGHPKNDKCEEFFPNDISEANAIRDESSLKLAQAGPDWKCKYCETLQTTIGPFCSNCGADKTTGAKPWEAKVKSVTQNTVTGEKHENGAWIEDLGHEHGGQVIFHGNAADKPVGSTPKNTFVGVRHAKGGWATTSVKIDEVEQLRPSNRFPWLQIGISGLVVAALVVTLWLVFRTKIVVATVSDTAWEYKVLIDRYQVWHREGWNADNGAFDVHDLGPRIHHYDKVVSGHHQESYPESYACGETCTTTPRTCRSNKNGSATCTGGDRSCSPKTCTRMAYRTVTDYRDEPRYQNWYVWNVWDWGYNRTVVSRGLDMEPSWPRPEQLAAVLREGEQERQRREEHYKITFVSPENKQCKSTSDRFLDKCYAIEPKTYQEFMSYPKGRGVRLKVGIAYGVEVLPDKP